MKGSRFSFNESFLFTLLNKLPMKEDCSQVEVDWLQRLQQNDEKALALLMKRYYCDLYNYAARFTRDDGLIKDCIQEVFISLWQRRQIAGTILSPKYYLIRAVKNKVIKSIHKNVRNTDADSLDKEFDFFQEFSIEKIIIEKQLSEEKKGKLRKALTILSNRQREIIYLKYYHTSTIARLPN